MWDEVRGGGYVDWPVVTLDDILVNIRRVQPIGMANFPPQWAPGAQNKKGKPAGTSFPLPRPPPGMPPPPPQWSPPGNPQDYTGGAGGGSGGGRSRSRGSGEHRHPVIVKYMAA